MREIVIIDAIDNLSGRKRAAIGQQVHHIEVEGDVLIGKAFGFKSLVERVVWDPPAVNREEYILAGWKDIKSPIQLSILRRSLS